MIDKFRKLGYDEEKLMKLIDKDIKNKEYHKVHNKKVREAYKLALEMGLVKK